jgi:PAP2 superfamily C-terminal
MSTATETIGSSEPPAKLRPIMIRILITVAAVFLWFWTQSLIAGRTLPSAGIGDRIHTLTAPLNQYLLRHRPLTNALLIVSSGIIDSLGIFLLGMWIFGRTVRPFLGLVLLLGLRQLMEGLVALPRPPNAIWHYPGFPSLLVTYGVSNDFFFSGHTAIAVLGAIEIARLRRNWLTRAAGLIVIFEIATVLVLRAHYTMDVFTGAIAALYIAGMAERLSPYLDRNLDRTLPR